MRLTGQRPDAEELKILKQLLSDEREYFTAHPADAKQFIAIGDAKIADDEQLVSLAALTTVCQAILNLDATICKR